MDDDEAFAEATPAQMHSKTLRTVAQIAMRGFHSAMADSVYYDAYMRDRASVDRDMLYTQPSSDYDALKDLDEAIGLQDQITAHDAASGDPHSNVVEVDPHYRALYNVHRQVNRHQVLTEAEQADLNTRWTDPKDYRLLRDWLAYGDRFRRAEIYWAHRSRGPPVASYIAYPP